MKKTYLAKMVAAACFVSMLALSGCASENNAGGGSASSSESDDAAVTSIDVANMDFSYTERDKDGSYDAATATTINLLGSTAEVEGAGASAAEGLVSIESAGTYIVTGEFQGAVVLSAEKNADIQLVLDGANITNETGPAIEVASANKVYVTLAENSSNTLSDGGNYTLAEGEDEPNATLYSKADLALNGSGSLTINASYEHAVNSKDSLVITGGTYNIQAKEDGLRGKDCVKILDGDFTITAGGDGIKSSKDTSETQGFISIDGATFVIDAQDDGMQAATYLRLTDGNATIKAGDDALQSDIDGNISGGSFTTNSTGKGINVDMVLTIDNGTLDINTENEGMEAEKVYINDGTITIVSADDGINAAASKTRESTETESEEPAAEPLAGEGNVEQADATGAQEPPQGQKGEPGGDMDGAPGGAGPGGNMSGAPGGAGPGGGETADENCFIQINGGTITITAGGDCLDSNGDLEVNGGIVYALAWGPGDEAVDSSGTATIADGTVIQQGATSSERNRR